MNGLYLRRITVLWLLWKWKRCKVEKKGVSGYFLLLCFIERVGNLNAMHLSQHWSRAGASYNLVFCCCFFNVAHIPFSAFHPITGARLGLPLDKTPERHEGCRSIPLAVMEMENKQDVSTSRHKMNDPDGFFRSYLLFCCSEIDLSSNSDEGWVGGDCVCYIIPSLLVSIQYRLTPENWTSSVVSPTACFLG